MRKIIIFKSCFSEDGSKAEMNVALLYLNQHIESNYSYRKWHYKDSVAIYQSLLCAKL